MEAGWLIRKLGEVSNSTLPKSTMLLCTWAAGRASARATGIGAGSSTWLPAGGLSTVKAIWPL